MSNDHFSTTCFACVWFIIFIEIYRNSKGPEGYYCPCNSCPPRVCPDNSICPSGSAQYIKCSIPFYYVKNNSDKACSKTIQFYLVITGSVASFLILVLLAFLAFKKKKKIIKSGNLKKLLTETPVLYHGY